jgi:hypothetical protein
MSIENGKRFIELVKKREQLEGTRIMGLLLNLATSQHTVNRNYEELSKAMAWYEGNLSIWDIAHRHKLDAFMKEFKRLSQNYLSSTYSLIEHTRIFCKELNNSKLNEEYSVKSTELRSHVAIRFVRDLRTYSQHIKLPIVSATLSLTPTEQGSTGKIEQKILLEKEELLKWKDWHKDSRKHIESKKKIDLNPILAEYQTLVKGFYDWLYRRVGELYRKQLDEFAEVERELSRLS